MRNKVLIIVPSLTQHGGVSNYYRELELNNVSNNIEYFVLDKYNHKIKFFEIIKVYFNFCLKIKKYDIIKVNPSFQINAFLRSCLFLFISKLLSKKVIIFIRGWSDSFESSLFKNKFLRLFFFKLWLKADAIIVLGRFFKKKLIAYGYSNKIFLETTVSPKFADKPKAISKSSEINLLLISRIIEEKGIFIAIKTMEIIKNNNPNLNISLTIAGDGPDFCNLKDYIDSNNLNNCRLVGYIEGEDKLNLLKKSHFLFFPTFHGEGMPNCIIEAISHGMPVISRDVGGISDHINNRLNGYITTSLDPNIFAQKILELIDNKLYVKMSKYNLSICKKFSPKDITVRLKKIYDEI